MFDEIYNSLEEKKSELWKKINSTSENDDESSALKYIKMISDIKTLTDNIKSCEEKYDIIIGNLNDPKTKSVEIEISQGAISQSYLALGNLKKTIYSPLIPKSETKIKIRTYINGKKYSEFETEYIGKLSRFKDRKNLRLFYQQSQIKENEKITFTEIEKDKVYEISYCNS